uniref:P6 n=1 Tax=Lotus corniculatus virus 1 TaxID=2793731 RepID=A0A8D9UIW6_9RHAB|nr:TPA_asm: P6 [Lotus corniculatus virus 1]
MTITNMDLIKQSDFCLCKWCLFAMGFVIISIMKIIIRLTLRYLRRGLIEVTTYHKV